MMMTVPLLMMPLDTQDTSRPAQLLTSGVTSHQGTHSEMMTKARGMFLLSMLGKTCPPQEQQSARHWYY